MPYVIEYDKVATIISIKRVKDPGIVVYTLIFKVGKRKFTAYLGQHLDEDYIKQEIERTYEQQTEIRKIKEYKEKLPGSKVYFKSEIE